MKNDERQTLHVSRAARRRHRRLPVRGGRFDPPRRVRDASVEMRGVPGRGRGARQRSRSPGAMGAARTAARARPPGQSGHGSPPGGRLGQMARHARSGRRRPQPSSASASALERPTCRSTYGRDGFSVRTGWRQPAAAAPVALGGRRRGFGDPVDTGCAVARRSGHARGDAARRNPRASAATRCVGTSGRARGSRAEAGARRLIANSERRQQLELALRVGDMINDVAGPAPRRPPEDRSQYRADSGQHGHGSVAAA